MVKYNLGRAPNLIPFRRTKPGIGAENHTTIGGAIPVNRRLTQFSIGACSSGTLVHVTDPTLPVKMNVFTYNDQSHSEGLYKSVEDIPVIPSAPDKPVLWVEVDGIHYPNIISDLGERYNIHSLVQADIGTIEQRTKLDVFDDALFLVCKVIYRDMSGSGRIHIEQMSFYLKEDVLITFQETPKQFLFESIKSNFHRANSISFMDSLDRIRQGKGRLRKMKVDYLFYSLVDVIVDHYMDVLDTMGTKVESIDNQLMKTLKRDTLEAIYDMKRDMLYLRSIISPLKEIIIKLQKEDETQIMQESTNIYLKDLFDHVIQVNDSIDTYREMLASFIDFYMMLNSNAMNEVVKTLTIISTIFIPLTFITGIYGMNFDNMPELRFKYGYYIVLACMASLAIFMLSCFKRKHWF